MINCDWMLFISHDSIFILFKGNSVLILDALNTHNAT